jgi:hypothetical protein
VRNRPVVIRPFGSKRGIISLLVLLLVAVATLATAVVIMVLIHDYRMLPLFCAISGVFIVLGGVLFCLFPRVKLVFEPLQGNVTVKSKKLADQVIPFGSLEPFQIYEVLRGYAHQYYCKNGTFGQFSDLFFGTLHKGVLKKAKKLARLTGGVLFDYDGKSVDLGQSAPTASSR